VELLETTIGALRLGVVPVPVNPLLTETEAHYLISDSGADWLFTDREVPVALAPRIVHFDEPYESLLAAARPAPVADHALTRPMHYTSGTTGRPKGVWAAPVSAQEAAARSDDYCFYWSLQTDEVHLVCSPLAHSAPHRFSLHTLEAGGTVVVQESFEAGASLGAISTHRVTSSFMVPTHLDRILRAVATSRSQPDLTSVRMLAHAGAPISTATKVKVLDLFPAGSVWEFYGATEGAATRISAAEWLSRPGSVGRPQPGHEIVIMSGGGAALDPGQVGFVWIRPPRGRDFEYWKDPAKTSAAWTNGAFTVGDLGYVDDDGYLFLKGRVDDTIITGGVNVYPQEIEAVLAEHPAVEEVCVYGVPSDEWGQEVRALIIPNPTMDRDDLDRWARQRLASYKMPKVIRYVTELPRTPTGKVKRPS
jgi:acyl-CoA synthetase (AMP-forming)/AMP-acid ligase II